MRYPAIDEQLAALNSDLAILQDYRDAILDFWSNVTTDMDLYLSINNGKDYRQILAQEVSQTAASTEWANLSVHGNSTFLEIILQLGWGKPEEAYYKRGLPTSGSEYIHAVNAGQYPIY